MKRRLFAVLEFGRRSCLGSLGLTVLLGMASTALLAQSPPADLVESVEVEVVEVQVFVSDRDGEPVAGLGAADFRLRVDGEARPIGNFFEARATTAPAAATAAARTGATPAPAVPPADASLPAAETQRLSLVILLDELHLTPHERGKTLTRLAPMLRERLEAGDDLMIASFDRSLRVLRPFEGTADLGGDLAAIAKRASGGIGTERERQRALAEIIDLHVTRGCAALPEMGTIARAWTGAVENETRATLNAIEELLLLLAGRGGRKALLFVSTGLPLDPGLEAQLLLHELCQVGRGAPQTGLADPLHAVTRAANASQVTFYSLDAGGQRVFASALHAARGLGVASTFEVRSNLQDPVFALAADTGGRALLESNQPEKLLADLSRDLAAYYSLGFTPRPSDAGSSHRIEVEVTRPGLRVRHRAAWQPLSMDERVAAALVGGLRLGGDDENPLGARLEIGAPRRTDDGTYVVQLRLAVPAAALALLPHGDRLRGNLKVFLAVGDASGRTTPVRTLPLPVDVAAGDGETQVPLQIDVRLGPGENRIALAVRDELTQQTAVLRRRVQAGKAR